MSLRRTIALFGLLASASAPARAAEGPERFGEGVFSTPAWDFFVAFTADQKTAYFCRANGSFTYFTILTSTRAGEKWSEPKVAPFSGRWSDADPHVSPDGLRLFFISNRPIAAGDTIPRDDYDIWVCDWMSGGGWSEPRHVPPPVSLEGTTEWSPSPAANGNLYFGSARPGGKGANDLYVAKWNGAGYDPPENLGDSLNTRAGEVEPWVAPDESYLLFSGQGRPDGLGGFDLYLSRRQDGVWQRPEHLGHGVNSPGGDFNQSVSPDGKWLYFSSTRGSFDRVPRRRLTYAEMQRRLTGLGNGLGDIYRIELATLGIAPRSR